MRGDLAGAPEGVRLARHAFRAVKQNLFWAFVYNALAVPLALAGPLHPAVAAAAMATSSLCVVANSCRLRGGA